MTRQCRVLLNRPPPKNSQTCLDCYAATVDDNHDDHKGVQGSITANSTKTKRLNSVQSRTLVYGRYLVGKLMLYQLSYSRAMPKQDERRGLCQSRMF
ncbi:MAG: hypothetical protein ACI8W3_003239 [Myxococcota bacterium]